MWQQRGIGWQALHREFPFLLQAKVQIFTGS